MKHLFLSLGFAFSFACGIIFADEPNYADFYTGRDGVKGNQSDIGVDDARVYPGQK